MAVLTWIATRSLKLTEKLAFSHPAEAGRFLFETRRKFGAPLQLSYSNSFNSLNEKIESHVHKLSNMRHGLTILAYEMNGKPLSVLHGAPLWLRCENELG